MAMSANGAVARQSRILALPPRFVLIDSNARPSNCLIPHSLGRGPDWVRDESVVVLTFTRPVIVNGYAFVEEYEECAGLCGTTFLRVFQKKGGQWIQVSRTILSVS
jgi:hypothetical protein